MLFLNSTPGELDAQMHITNMDLIRMSRLASAMVSWLGPLPSEP